MKYKTWMAGLTLLILAGFIPRPAMSDQEPATGAARVSVINGNVATQRGDSGEWVASTVNAPLVRGDSVSTASSARTEVQLDYANVMRLDQSSVVKIADLTRSRIQLQLAQGVMTFTVFKGSQADVEIDTSNVAVHPTSEGTYRIQVVSPSETVVTVREKGQAEVSTPQGSAPVKNNETITVEGTESPQYKISEAPGRDQWDNWNRERDAAIQNANSYRYTNSYYTGAQDLDRYGHWVDVPGYDWCWTPYVDAGWVPYQSGRWVWEPDWGWTWVSYDPWGWAPYHYGRWFYSGASWYWWPGVAGPGFFPTWGPAWVDFIGFGFGRHHFGFGFGFGFSSIGWCPLGPFDPFFPWWGFGNSFNVVNITNITNVTNINNISNIRNITTVPRGVNGIKRGASSNLALALRDPKVRRGVTVVSAKDFLNGRTPRQMPTVGAAALRSGQVVKGTLPVVPTRASLQPVNRPVNRAALPSRAASNQSFFTRHQPPAGPQSFESRASQIQQMVQSRNVLETARGGNGATAHPAAEGTASAAVNGARVSASAQSSGQAMRAANARSGSATAASGQGAWHRFGPQGSGPAAASPATAERGYNPQPNAPTARSFQPQSTPRAPQSSDRSFQPQSAPRAPQSSEGGGWRQFTPRSAPTRPDTRPSQPATPEWNRLSPRSERAPQVQGGRAQGWGGGSPFYRSGPSSVGYSRPPLELSKPIVTQRAPMASPGGYRGGGGGGSRGGGGYSGSSGRGGSSGHSSSPSRNGGHR